MSVAPKAAPQASTAATGASAAGTTMFGHAPAGNGTAAEADGAGDGRVRTVERVLHMNVTGSLNEFDEKGATAGTWRPRDGKEVPVFAPIESGIENNLTTTTEAIKNSRIRKVSCLEYRNTFPIPIGIKCDNIPQCESTDLGHRYLMTMLPVHGNSNEQQLYSSDDTSMEAQRWTREYPKYNERNLNTCGVMEVRSHPVCFVDKDHPVISLLRANKDILGSDIDAQTLVQGRWHTVSRQCFNTAVKTLRQKVMPNVNISNLGGFTLQATPLDRKSWCNIGKGEHVEEMQRASTKDQVSSAHKAAMNKPYNITARFKVVYEYPLSA